MDKLAFRAAVAKWVDEHTEEMVSTLQDFCRIPSVSRADLAQPNAPFGPDCRRMLDYALDTAKKMGFEPRDYEGYCGAAVMGDDDHALGLIAHLDVVPEGDGWRWPPYSAHREGDYIYSRGVSDNKSPAVAGLYLMRMFRELGIPLKHGIKLLFGCAEETGMADVKYFTAHYPSPAFVLVPDASYPVNYAQKGMIDCTLSRPLGEDILSFEGGQVTNAVPAWAKARLAKPVELSAEDITCTGDVVDAAGLAAHAAHPDGGKNAFVTLANALSPVVTGESKVAMEELALLAGDLFAERLGFACEDPDSGKTTVNIGVAKAQNGILSVTLDSRVSVGDKPEHAFEALCAYAKVHGWTITDERLSASMFIPRDDPKVQALQSLYFELTGDDAAPYAMGGGTYARRFENALTFGPGGSPASKGHEPDWLAPGHGGAHAPDEYCYIPTVTEFMRIYAEAILMLDELVP